MRNISMEGKVGSHYKTSASCALSAAQGDLRARQPKQPKKRCQGPGSRKPTGKGGNIKNSIEKNWINEKGRYRRPHAFGKELPFMGQKCPGGGRRVSQKKESERRYENMQSRTGVFHRCSGYVIVATSRARKELRGKKGEPRRVKKLEGVE